MRGGVFLKTLRDQRRGLIGWGIGIVLLVAVMAALWPSVRGIPNLDEFLANYPEPLRELFNFEEITTGRGFLNAELFSFMLPVMFLVFAISRGARLVAGEEESGLLEPVLATPVSRAQALTSKGLALVASIAVLGLILFVALVVATSAASMEVAAGEIAGGSIAVTLLGVLHGLLALAVGAGFGGRARAMGTAASVAAAGYVLYVAGEFVDGVKAWQPLSPFTHTLGTGPLAADIPLPYAWIGLAAAAALAGAIPFFDRRDLRT